MIWVIDGNELRDTNKGHNMNSLTLTHSIYATLHGVQQNTQTTANVKNMLLNCRQRTNAAINLVFYSIPWDEEEQK